MRTQIIVCWNIAEYKKKNFCRWFFSLTQFRSVVVAGFIVAFHFLSKIIHAWYRIMLGNMFVVIILWNFD